MRLLKALLSYPLFVAFANAEAFQYSPGWSPGQTVKPMPSSVPSSGTSGATSHPKPEPFSWSSIFTSGPIGSFLSRSGINMTERLAEAERKAKDLPWDDRIPMIRDDNYQQLITNESFATPEEEEARVWFLIVTSTSQQRSGLSSLVDQHFNEAYNISVIQNDLPHVRWGRIDYLNVTRLTTKWGVWRAPLLIIATHRGTTLRFFHPQALGVKATFIRSFLTEELWRRMQPWTSPWAPGGSREELLDKFAVFLEKLYFYQMKIPYWMYLILTGALASLLMTLIHGRDNKAKQPPVNPQRQPKLVTEESKKTGIILDPPASPDTKKGATQKRKSNKK